MNGFFSFFGYPDLVNKLKNINNENKYEHIYKTQNGILAYISSASGEISQIAFDKSNNIVCVFSGVIYKYVDKALIENTDSNYIIKAYLKYGENMYNYFEGKFVLALYDLNKSTA